MRSPGCVCTGVLAACVSVLLVAGRAPAVRSTRFADFPAWPPGRHIEIYRSGRPERSYKEIGIVSARQRNTLMSMESVARSLKDAARKMGGDAIVDVTEMNEVWGFVGSTGLIDRDPVLSGPVIRYTDH